MTILSLLILSLGSVLLFFCRMILKTFGWIGRKTQEGIEDEIKKRKAKNAPISLLNWYDKASTTCGETVDALLNRKTGKTERIVRSLAAKLGVAGSTAGLFSIASAFGTAGTGTAISTLSGAAFTSAALKWLGGGISMAAGGWVVGLVSVVIGVISYFVAQHWTSKLTGKKRSLKHLDYREKRVIDTLTLIAIGFRKQADQERRLVPASAAILHDKVFEALIRELQECIAKTAHWPDIPRNRLKQKAVELRELLDFLRATKPPAGVAIPQIRGAEGVDIVPLTVLKLLSNPIPALSQQEEQVLAALRRTNKCKLKNSSMGELSEYLRLERIDRLIVRLKKVRRIYRKLSKTRNGSIVSHEYDVALVQSTDRTSIEVLIQNRETREASKIVIQGPEHARLLGDRVFSNDDLHASSEDASIGPFSEFSHSLHLSHQSEILENLSVAAMIALAKGAGAYLSGRPISKQARQNLVANGIVTISVAGLSELIM